MSALQATFSKTGGRNPILYSISWNRAEEHYPAVKELWPCMVAQAKHCLGLLNPNMWTIVYLRNLVRPKILRTARASFP